MSMRGHDLQPPPCFFVNEISFCSFFPFAFVSPHGRYDSERDGEADGGSQENTQNAKRKQKNIIRYRRSPLLTIERCPVAVGECPLELGAADPTRVIRVHGIEPVLERGLEGG